MALKLSLVGDTKEEDIEIEFSLEKVRETIHLTARNKRTAVKVTVISIYKDGTMYIEPWIPFDFGLPVDGRGRIKVRESR